MKNRFIWHNYGEKMQNIRIRLLVNLTAASDTIAHLKRELRDVQDALDALKKPSAFWENDRSHLIPMLIKLLYILKGRGTAKFFS